MPDTFVSEPIEPVADSFKASGRAGEPALPMRFLWRGDEYEIAEVLDVWKESSAKHGESEKYLRKHWYRVRTTCGHKMKIYFERQARSAASAKQRWWLYTIDAGDGSHGQSP